MNRETGRELGRLVSYALPPPIAANGAKIFFIVIIVWGREIVDFGRHGGVRAVGARKLRLVIKNTFPML